MPRLLVHTKARTFILSVYPTKRLSYRSSGMGMSINVLQKYSAIVEKYIFVVNSSDKLVVSLEENAGISEFTMIRKKLNEKTEASRKTLRYLTRNFFGIVTLSALRA